MSSQRIVTAVVTFFAGVGVIIGVVLVVYAVSYLADRFSCMGEGALTEEEFEERQNASEFTIQSGLAGLLTNERNQIYRALFDKRSFPYHKAPTEDEKVTGKGEKAVDLEAQTTGTETEKESSVDNHEDDDDNDDEASGELSVDNVNAPTCSICLNEYHNGDKVIVGTACSHMFHYDCCMQWVYKGNDHCPYCRENMISAQEFCATALEVVGEERVGKLKKINRDAARRVAALTASGTRTIQDVVPPVGQRPISDVDDPAEVLVTAPSSGEVEPTTTSLEAE